MLPLLEPNASVDERLKHIFVYSANIASAICLCSFSNVVYGPVSGVIEFDALLYTGEVLHARLSYANVYGFSDANLGYILTSRIIRALEAAAREREEAHDG